MKTSSVTLYSTGYRETRTYLAAALFAAGNIAGYAARRFNRVSVALLAAVVLFYQIVGSAGEWALTGSFTAAVQDFRIGIPGMLLQVFGGYLFIKYVIRK